MSTTNTTPQFSMQQLVEQRLDAIDQALLGLLPRPDRLATVAQVESRIRERVGASPATGGNSLCPDQGKSLPELQLSSSAPSSLAFPPQSPFFVMPPGGWNFGTQKKRSRLAVSSAALGIVALVLLFSIPIMYFVVGTLSEVLGETFAIAAMGAHVVTVALGGAMAIGLGIAALVKLRRHRDQLVGHGWAIAGLCTGPLPMMLGCATAVYFGMELGLSQFVTTSVSAEAGDVVVPASPDSEDETGPQALSVSPLPTPVAQVPPQDFIPPQVRSTSPDLPSEVNALYGTDAIPSQPASASAAPQPDAVPNAGPSPQAEPQPAPRPESPSEPVPTPDALRR